MDGISRTEDGQSIRAPTRAYGAASSVVSDPPQQPVDLRHHAIGLADVLDHVVPADVACRVLIPLHALSAPGPCIADLFGQLPAVLALRPAQQSFQIQPRLPPRLRAHEQSAQPVRQDSQFITSAQHILCFHQHAPS
jgi:hypothetical protein